jgi:hypothetical protein
MLHSIPGFILVSHIFTLVIIAVIILLEERVIFLGFKTFDQLSANALF